MMKTEKLLAVVMTLWMLGVISMIAQPRSIQELDAIANSVLANNGARSVNRMVMSMTSSQVLKSIPMGQDETFYVYTPAVGKKEGFVIVSGDKRMPAVLGYSDKNAFDATHIPDGLRWFLEKCHADISLVNSGAAIVASSENQSKSVSIAPLLGNRVWDQGKPFNNYCPEVSAGIRTVTGCTATAMAQIMAYHRHPAKGTGNISYTTPTFGYSVQADMDNASAYDWGNMIDSYDGAYSTTQAKAVAQLMFHAGAAIATDFCEISSGANTNSPEGAFVTHFGYDDEIRIVRRTDCADDTWSTLLQQEIAAGRPVLVSGFDNSGYGGHAFVFDGLDTEGNFHINWGWSGLCDGYYNLYNLIPEETGVGGGFGEYNYNCQAVVGIHPEDGVKETDPTNIVVEYTTSANGLGTFDLNTSISLNLQNFINMRHLSFKGDAQLMLTDATGDKTIAMLGSPLFINTPSGLPQGSYIENFSLTTSLPDDIANGDYRLYIGVRQSGYEQWGRARAQIADIPYHYDYYELTVADGKYILGRINTDNDKEEDYEGIPKTVEQISSRKVYTIHNNLGTLGIQNGRLVLNSQEANQFVFYKHNGRFYLYNLEKQSFIGLDDNVEERERYALVNSIPSAVMLRRGLDDSYPFAIKFDNLWLNTNLGYEIVANSQNWLSVGNQFRLVPTETMTEMQEYRMLQKIKTVQENSTIFTNILPFGTEQAWKSKYRFSESLDNYEEPVLDANGRNWKDLDYDDSAWPTLTGPMAGGYYYPVINHDWNGVNNAYELRRKFRLDEKPRGLFTFSVIHDFDIKIYLNGNLVAEKQIDSGSSFDEYLIPADWFLQGDNILAIYIRKCNKSFLDYSLYNERLPEIYTDKQGVKYQLAVDGGPTASVIGHSKTYRNAIIIPNEIMGYTVTGIASKAFADVNDLITVTMLSENPYVIPEDAFSETIFQNTQLIVPYSCYSVYQKTSGWNKFKNITYIAPDEYTDEQGVVYALKNGDTYYVKGFTDKLISKVVLPETLLGKPVTMIDNRAFEKSSQLEEIVISDSVTLIGTSAFSKCPILKKVHIGCGVEIINGELFYNSPLLGSITVDENNRYFSSYNGFLYDKSQTTLYAVPSTVSSLAESDFPSTLTRIEGSVSNVDVDDVVIPATVSIIDDLFFKRCKSLTLLSHACQISGNFCRFIENLYLHAYYPPQFLGEAVFGSQVNENCVIHVPVGLKTFYQETISKSGKSLTVIDDIELPSSIDVDYSLGYNYYIEPVGHMTKQITCSKLGTGFLLTKEQIKAYKGCRIVSFQAHISNSVDNELCAVITDGAGGKVLNQSKVFIGYFSGWKKILFDQPYTITGEEDELFIGITSTNEIRLSYTETIVPENALWFDWGGLERTNWQPWTGMGLALSYTVESDNLPANIRMMDVSLTADEKGNNHIKGKVENCTIGLVDGFDIAYSIDDGEIMTLHIDMPMVAKRLYEFEVEIPAEVPPGEHQMNVWVSKVGNRPDGIDSDSRASFILIGQNERYARKVVVEEGTGTWCGFCPRGIVAMHTMMQNHPDNFIPIAIHSGDNMVSPSYNQIFGLLGGTFPSYTMNRKYFGSPYTVDLETYYQQEVGKAVACIKMNAQWTDVDKNVVKIKTTSRFAYDMTDEFRIAYVVTESGVGPYPQANYYCNSKEEMGGFEKEGEVVSIVHNHVARSISSLNGESGPAQPKGMTDYEYSYMLTLPDNIDNKENIQLIVLLINQETGEIVNADNVDVSDVKEYNSGDFTYTLTYMVDGETYATEEIEYGETIVLKDAPKKEGYLFSGWSKVPATMPAHDVTVTGTFTVDGIEEIVTERLVDVYTLQGVMVKRQISVDELKHELSRGIYIINGKKVVVR